MEDKSYHFEHEQLIVAFDQSNNFAGIFVTRSDEEISKSELLDYFYDRPPNYLIVAELPHVDDEELTAENYLTVLEDLVEDLRKNDISGLDIEYYIPKTIH